MVRHLFAVPDELLHRVPLIAEELGEELERWREKPRESYGENPGCDYIFGSLLVPIVSRLSLELPASEAKATLESLFVFLEELMRDDNSNVGTMVKDSFCPSAVEDPSALSAIRALGGPRVREFADYLFELRHRPTRWGWLGRLFGSLD